MKIKSYKKAYQKSIKTEIFSRIYKKNLWGGEKGKFYSGTGSHNNYVEEYAEIIAQFIIENNIESIVEIGCGDFTVTNKILKVLELNNFTYNYTGYDIVKDLIKENKRMYGSENIQFKCKDSCTEKINTGDLLLIRQVLQHLDNKSIKQIVKKFSSYKYIIVSEHQPAISYGESIVPNLDKDTDAENRIHLLSAVYLDQEPFNCRIDSLLYSIDERCYDYDAQINTFLIKYN